MTLNEAYIREDIGIVNELNRKINFLDDFLIVYGENATLKEVIENLRQRRDIFNNKISLFFNTGNYVNDPSLYETVVKKIEKIEKEIL